MKTTNLDIKDLDLEEVMRLSKQRILLNIDGRPASEVAPYLDEANERIMQWLEGHNKDQRILEAKEIYDNLEDLLPHAYWARERIAAHIEALTDSHKEEEND